MCCVCLCVQIYICTFFFMLLVAFVWVKMLCFHLANLVPRAHIWRYKYYSFCVDFLLLIFYFFHFAHSLPFRFPVYKYIFSCSDYVRCCKHITWTMSAEKFSNTAYTYPLNTEHSIPRIYMKKSRKEKKQNRKSIFFLWRARFSPEPFIVFQ